MSGSGFLDNNYNKSVEQIELLLRRVCFYVKKRGRSILDNYDITPAQFEALQIVINHQEVTISELSNHLYQAPSTITDLVDRMEGKELVQRVRNCKDRRIVKIIPLEKGQKVLDAVLDARRVFLGEALKDVNLKDQAQFINYLEILSKAYNDRV